MPRIHYQWQWFALSDPTREEALHDMPAFRGFAKLGKGVALLPDEMTILKFSTSIGSGYASSAQAMSRLGHRAKNAL